ncbi:MAG: aminoacyl-tRNA hydrolase, partial [Acidobacteriaceae bacterium]|nr:aminoacyl-tRNA hydrolase [Acidobacteriaceae bacterium]
MKVIAGLGNPGVRYHETPHNIGFWVVDELAKRH